MITVDIEKEIQQENKIFKGLSIRKAICLLGAIILSIIFTIFLGVDLSIYPSLVVGVLLFLVGWYKKDGLTAGKIAIKYLKDKFYKNNTRKYRTKNKYITLLNNEYKRHKNIDIANKKIAKQIKNETKKQLKGDKKITLNAIQ